VDSPILLVFLLFLQRIMHVIQSKTCRLDYLIWWSFLSISFIYTFITHKEHQERSFKHIQDKLKKMWVYPITPTLPSLKESWWTLILACLYSFETDISRSDMILVLCIKKKTSIRYDHRSANEKLVTLLNEWIPYLLLVAQWRELSRQVKCLKKNKNISIKIPPKAICKCY